MIRRRQSSGAAATAEHAARLDVLGLGIMPLEGVVEFFDTFGFAVVRGALPDAALLRQEITRAFISNYGPRFSERPCSGGIEGHYLLFDPSTTPLAHNLIASDRTKGLAEALLGGEVEAQQVEAALFFGESGWHDDDGIGGGRGVGVFAYLTPLTASTGAFRVLPGSHLGHNDETFLRFVHTALPGYDRSSLHDAIPSYVCETRPGDLIAFDESIWHASRGGTDRLAWTARYRRLPTSDAERSAFDMKQQDASSRRAAVAAAMRARDRA